MKNFRPTKAIINLGAIERNTKKLIAKYSGYKYYTAVVKADCYGYRGFDVVRAMIKGGANLLAASLVEEGASLREEFPNIPIMLFNPVEAENLEFIRDNNLIVTVATQSQAESAKDIEGLKVSIRANGGCDILGGPKDKESFRTLFETLKNGKCDLVGIYLHSYNAECESDTLKEYALFEEMTEGLDLSQLDMVSISNSLTLPRHPKKSYCNACRLGNIVYKIESDDVDLENTFSLITKVLDVFRLDAGESIAYSHAFTATEDSYIAAIPIGFGDGFSKTNIGRSVYINGKAYKVVAITMDISHLLVDESINKNDDVYLIKDTHHLEEISAHIHGATEEAICALNKRVYREYIE